jgi:centromeric protein E
MNGLKPPRTPSVATDSSSDTMGPVWSVQNDNKTVASMNQYSSPTNNTSSNSFTFDHAYGPQHSTLDIYNNSVRDSVIATMDGYHSSVFAYGQTATGKTFTMSGNKSSQLNHHSKQYDQSVYDSNSIGIIQHSINDCFRYIQQQKNDIREYILRVSFMEIYNEVIYDLLAPPPTVKPIMNMSTSLSSSTNTKFNNSHETGLPLHSDIRIFESKQEGIVIRGLKEEIVTSPEQIFALIALGESRRQTGQTSANKQSSRSHSVFRLIVESRKRNISSTTRNNNSSSNSTPRRKNLQSQMSDDNFSTSGSESISSSVFSPGTSSGPVRVSTLSLVDLAGSESVRNTGSTGIRQKEGQYINKSLLTLGHVVRKLADLTNREDMNLDTSHIPYRDSKLTRILQPSLSGNAQIAIICNISPLQKHFDETVNTLKFASRAKRIKQNATITEVMEENTLLQDYRQEIDELKQQLKEAKEMHESIISKQKQEVEQEAEQQQYPVIGDRTEEENDEDIQVIVQAISNLERLILKTSTDEEAKKIKRRKERMKKNKRIIEGMEALEGGKVGGDIAKVTGEKPGGSTGGDSDTLLNMMNNEQGIDDDLIDDATLLTKKTVKSVDETSVATGGENGDLISELHRIQGLLGTVLVRRNTPINPTSPTRSPRNNVLKTSDRDEEVQRLKAQLHETERSSSLRKADSSFLQQQLNAKDELLKEVSKLLESVEQRQMALEQDNAEVRNEWARAIASLRAKETEFENVTSLLKAKEAEITELRRKLGEQ